MRSVGGYTPTLLTSPFNPLGTAEMTVSIQAEIPDLLLAQARLLVREGWAGKLDDILADALRRYLDSHRAELAESFLREDLEWGLHGDDCGSGAAGRLRRRSADPPS